ncbi:MAG: hypothetical protein GY856_18650 [bacterium]|nr:hypothetical protein [bacterium]
MFSLRYLPDRWHRFAERHRLAARTTGIRAALKQSAYAIDLLLERRLWLFLIVDVLLYLGGLIDGLVASGELVTLYHQTFLVPCLVLELPVLAGVVALERRAGSLDLALAVPSTERYFARRMAPVCAFFVGQGWLALMPGWLLLGADDGWDLTRAMLQSLVISLFLGIVTLFWAVHLKTAGGVFVASLITSFLLFPWMLTTPFLGRSGRVAAGTWIWNMTVLTLTATILYFYARQRLRRPETMLA